MGPIPRCGVSRGALSPDPRFFSAERAQLPDSGSYGLTEYQHVSYGIIWSHGFLPRIRGKWGVQIPHTWLEFCEVLCVAHAQNSTPKNANKIREKRREKPPFVVLCVVMGSPLF